MSIINSMRVLSLIWAPFGPDVVLEAWGTGPHKYVTPWPFNRLLSKGFGPLFYTLLESR